MTNQHIEFDIVSLLIRLEDETGNAGEIYGQISNIFEEMHARGEEIPAEFVDLKTELDQRFTV